MSDTLTVVDHPLILHKLTHMRRKDTSTEMFRRRLREIAQLLAYEVTRDLPLELVPIETPLAAMEAPQISGKKLCLVSILRAGNGMLDGMLQILPAARVGHVGLYRDPATLVPVEYYFKVPDDIADRLVDRRRPDARHRPLGGRGAQPAEGGRRDHDQVRLPARRARGHRGAAGRPPGRADLHRRGRRPSERPRLHHSRAGRRRRSAVRDEVEFLAAWRAGRAAGPGTVSEPCAAQCRADTDIARPEIRHAQA